MSKMNIRHFEAFSAFIMCINTNISGKCWPTIFAAVRNNESLTPLHIIDEQIVVLIQEWACVGKELPIE